MTSNKSSKQEERCLHMNFNANVQVTRLTDVDDGPVKTFAADIKVNCADCNMPFQWMGVGRGLSVIQPMMSADGFELRAPLMPLEEL